MSLNMYPSNFDNSDFVKQNIREFNGLKSDPCELQREIKEDRKKLQYITTNHIDLLNGNLQSPGAMSFFGIDFRDELFTPAKYIDQYSHLRTGGGGNILTNCNVRLGFGQLPIPTMPSRYQLKYGPPVLEQNMRNFYVNKSQACIPRDTELYKRHFEIFNPQVGVEIPDAQKSITDSKYSFFGPRGGVTTRFELREINLPKQKSKRQTTVNSSQRKFDKPCNYVKVGHNTYACAAMN